MDEFSQSQNCALIEFITDGLIVLECCPVTEVRTDWERGAIHFKYGQLSFRVDDRWYVEQRMEKFWEVTEVALLLQSLLKHRAMVTTFLRDSEEGKRSFESFEAAKSCAAEAIKRR